MPSKRVSLRRYVFTFAQLYLFLRSIFYKAEPDMNSTHEKYNIFISKLVLQEDLYFEIADLLNRGRQWELAVEIVKELVSVYEEEALGYAPLADLHTQLASLYDGMLRTPRSHPGYYRVLYHGKGFPELLRTQYVSCSFLLYVYGVGSSFASVYSHWMHGNTDSCVFFSGWWLQIFKFTYTNSQTQMIESVPK